MWPLHGDGLVRIASFPSIHEFKPDSVISRKSSSIFSEVFKNFGLLHFSLLRTLNKIQLMLAVDITSVRV